MTGTSDEEKTELLRFRISRPLYAYLGLLSRVTGLGFSENEVARFLLTERLQEFRGANYHKSHKLPKNINELDVSD